jgi:hypothetical protein
MDDELSQFEAELKRLRPAAPSRELLARLAGEIEPAAVPAPRAARAWWLWAGALPAAAALAVFLINGRRAEVDDTPAPVIAAGEFKPVAAENVLYAARDEGFVTLADGTTARRERLNYVDTITWQNPRTHASLKWTVPREEVRVVPVVFQ